MRYTLKFMTDCLNKLGVHTYQAAVTVHTIILVHRHALKIKAFMY